MLNLWALDSTSRFVTQYYDYYDGNNHIHLIVIIVIMSSFVTHVKSPHIIRHQWNEFLNAIIFFPGCFSPFNRWWKRFFLLLSCVLYNFSNKQPKKKITMKCETGFYRNSFALFLLCIYFLPKKCDISIGCDANIHLIYEDPEIVIKLRIHSEFKIANRISFIPYDDFCTLQ